MFVQYSCTPTTLTANYYADIICGSTPTKTTVISKNVCSNTVGATILLGCNLNYTGMYTNANTNNSNNVGFNILFMMLLVIILGI